MFTTRFSTGDHKLLYIDDCPHPGVNATHEIVRTSRQSRDADCLSLGDHRQISRARRALWRSSDVGAVQAQDGSSAERLHLGKCVAFAAAIGYTNGLSSV